MAGLEGRIRVPALLGAAEPPWQPRLCSPEFLTAGRAGKGGRLTMAFDPGKRDVEKADNNI